MLACGIGVAVAGASLGVMPLPYGGLAIAGLAIFRRFGIGDTSIYQTLRNLRRQRTF